MPSLFWTRSQKVIAERKNSKPRRESFPDHEPGFLLREAKRQASLLPCYRPKPIFNIVLPCSTCRLWSLACLRACCTEGLIERFGAGI
jgi:hypothetical protein